MSKIIPDSEVKPTHPEATGKMPRRPVKKKLAGAAAAGNGGQAAGAKRPVKKRPTGNQSDEQRPTARRPASKQPPQKSGSKPTQPHHSILDEIEEHHDRPKMTMMALVAIISAIAHGIVAIILALYMLPIPDADEVFGILSSTTNRSDEEELFEEIEMPEEEMMEEVEEVEEMNEEVVEIDEVIPEPEIAPVNINDLELSVPIEAPDDTGVGPTPDPTKTSQFGGRSSQASKMALLKAQGGNTESELAVTNGLKWLARVQQPDGGWDFIDAKYSGEYRTAATGMALMAFLGAGHTHEKGSYQTQVKRGIEFLGNNLKQDKDGFDLRGAGSGGHGMYCHAIANIALAEALAMSLDSLKPPKFTPEEQAKLLKLPEGERRALVARRKQKQETAKKIQALTMGVTNWSIRAQNPKGGGWQYSPRSGGDTSVTGWYVMALKSGLSAKLPVPKVSFQGATYFLNSVAANGGANYGYKDPGKQIRSTTTAVGLLCRMYMGWNKDNPALRNGVMYLSKLGPSTKGRNMYYNYYATQVLHHWGGDEWKKWNEVMRDHLTTTQTAEGYWNSGGGGHGAKEGGKLYETTLAIMTLEVYYRHLPLYQKKSITTELP